jgi:hypothetical protein
MTRLSSLDNLRYGKQAGFERLFKDQDMTIEGKPGVILADTGVPEAYEPEFYAGYINHVFHYMLPPFLHRMVLADRGIGLIDPENPMAREPFQPRQLIDFHGSFANKAGRPYAECPVAWRPPANPKNPWDHGYFLHRGEGPGGTSDIAQKTGAKVVGWYYGRLLPEKKVAWQRQCGLVYDEATARLRGRFPSAEFRRAFFVHPHSLGQAVDELLAAGCKTIIYQCFANPVYCDFEEYNYALPLVHEFAEGRARVICADQIGNQAPLREGYARRLRDALAQLPPSSSVLVILSKHGHPFKKETQDSRGALYREPLEAEIRKVMAGWTGKWDVVWSSDEYADDYWDAKQQRFETHEAYRRAIEQNYDYALELPTEFIAENTDLMIFHAMKKFNAFAEYDRNRPVPYPDWDQPLTREFHEGKTTGIYLGVLVGPYRCHVVDAVVDSVSAVLGGPAKSH